MRGRVEPMSKQAAKMPIVAALFLGLASGIAFTRLVTPSPAAGMTCVPPSRAMAPPRVVVRNVSPALCTRQRGRLAGVPGQRGDTALPRRPHRAARSRPMARQRWDCRQGAVQRPDHLVRGDQSHRGRHRGDPCRLQAAVRSGKRNAGRQRLVRVVLKGAWPPNRVESASNRRDQCLEFGTSRPPADGDHSDVGPSRV